MCPSSDRQEILASKEMGHGFDVGLKCATGRGHNRYTMESLSRNRKSRLTGFTDDAL